MPDAIVLCATYLGGVALIGAVAVATAPRWARPGRLAPLRRRVAPVLDTSSSHLTRPVTAAVVALAGWAATLIAGWLLGELAHALQDAVDWPVFRWFAGRQVGWWSDVWWVLTDIGSPDVTQTLTVLGALVLGALWYRAGMRWWVALVAPPAAYLMEKYGQTILKLVVDRGHPPTTHGTWPSGGCARVIVVYGLLVLLALLWSRTREPRAWVGGVAFVALAVSVQAYARTYNQEHWMTDVVGGVLWGWMLLAVAAAAVLVLDRGDPGRTPESGATGTTRRTRIHVVSGAGRD